MRKPVRKLMGVAVVGVLGALFAMPMLVAGAQEDAPPVATQQCLIQGVAPDTLPPAGATTTVTGTGPSGLGTVHMSLFVNGTSKATQDVADGAPFSLSAFTVPGDQLTVGYTYGNQSAYVGGCATVNNEVVILVKGIQVVATKPAAAAAAQALAFTGSNDTPSFVLVGIAALVLGAVLVIAARRRSQLS